MTDRPYDLNANVGDDVVFQCNAYAIPEASVVWYKNGEPIDRKSKRTLISAVLRDHF